MKNISILGSTGSIGTSTIKVVRSNPDRYRIVGLSAGNNIDLIGQQIEEFRPVAISVSQEAQAQVLKSRLSHDIKTEIYWGKDGYKKIAVMDEADIVVSAISGAAGLVPTYEAILKKKDIALANKETMVMAGAIIMALAEDKGISILPVDSEHSAVFQCMQGHNRADLRRIILTASGGPFRDFTLSQLENITPAMALKHPNWEMGKKITIDSATLMNKGLEIIEAKWLFNLDLDQIDVLVHPESIIHSMVEYNDGSVIAQMGVPDMITPISYALSYPEHLKTDLPGLRLEAIKSLHFYETDPVKFRCLRLAVDALKEGGSMPAVLNGANEIAVASFLNEEISFLQIPEIIERTMSAHRPLAIDSIETVIEADSWARTKALNEIMKLE
ncbi:MAG: 1-deoxy-D-xylulose-5-phosphate reductoisomerase [Deltaproteobacteria bacterium]|nr:1-deoxy-D-xylulose-5-phosphate reductoisomerase [Deltaproteobacteria bacterium]